MAPQMAGTIRPAAKYFTRLTTKGGDQNACSQSKVPPATGTSAGAMYALTADKLQRWKRRKIIGGDASLATAASSSPAPRYPPCVRDHAWRGPLAGCGTERVPGTLRCPIEHGRRFRRSKAPE